MPVTTNKQGDLVITIPKKDASFSVAEELSYRREALYDALEQHNRKDFYESENLYYGIVELLRDTEPDVNQLKQLFDNPSPL